jgi:hypothetical protein
MRPLIFIPQKDGKQPTFEDVGLGDLSRGIDMIPSKGPDGLSGMMCGWATPQDRDLLYNADNQTWIPASGRGGDAGRYWVGIKNESLPTEKELLRPDHRRGKFITMADGKQWLITRPADLDRFPIPQADGSIVWSVDEKFNSIVTQLERIKATRLISDGEASSFVFDMEDDFWLLCEILRLNYRMPPELVAHLRLLSDNSISETVAALFGLKLET